MKKYFLPALLVLAVACNNNADQKAAESTEPENKEAGNSLYGKWKVIGVSINGEKAEFGPGSLEIKENGDYIGIDGTLYKFSTKNDSLFILNAKDAKPIQSSKMQLADGKLKLLTILKKDTIETVLQK